MVCNCARNDFLKNENEQNVSSYFLVGEENFVDSDSCRNFSIKFLGPKKFMVGTAQSFLRVQKKVDKIKLKNVLDVLFTVKKKVR